MKTIMDELRGIAKVCITPNEFVMRAMYYLKNSYDVHEPLMSDSELRDIFRKVSYDNEVSKAWEVYKKVVSPMLGKRSDCKGLWYEAWIDLEDDWLAKWFASFRYMGIDAIVEVCVKYLNDRDHFYVSSDYTDMLDKRIADCE